MIPAANHVSYNSTSKTWSADNTATTVSVGFRIADDETVQVVKASGTGKLCAVCSACMIHVTTYSDFSS